MLSYGKPNAFFSGSVFNNKTINSFPKSVMNM